MTESEEARGPTRGDRRGRTLAVAVASVLLLAIGAALFLRPSAPPSPIADAPSPPGGLRGVPGDGQITLSWNPVSDADGYNIYQSSSPGVTKEGYGILPDGARYAHVVSPYTITGLSNGRAYYLRITSFGPPGESEVSAEISVLPVALPPPGPTAPASPEGVRGIAGDARITLDWDLVAGADGYNVYLASSPGVTKENFASLPDGALFADVLAPYTITGLVNDRFYYFRMTAFSAGGESAVSEESSAMPFGQPPLLAPDAPPNIAAVAGESSVVVSWGLVAGATMYHLYQASQSGVTKAGYATMPDGARLANVAPPYTLSGLTIGTTYYIRVTAENGGGESVESAEVSATPFGEPPGVDLYVTGTVDFDTGAPVPDAAVTVRTEDGSAVATGVTGADGSFNVLLRAMLPMRVLVEVRYENLGTPPVTGFRWSPVLSQGGAVAVGRIALPEPSTKQLAIAGSTAWSSDGSVVVEAFPSNVAGIWARSYDPDATPDVFPGDLAEGRDFPLNSVVFLWISAQDASGSPVVDVSPPATVRMQIPSAQWVDAEDLQPGNGVIDTPIYSLDYGTAYWVREPNGRLTDAAGVPIPEAFESEIRDGVYGGAVYAEFQADHFSWWNVDKPPKDCGPDFGDADDPPYPSLLASDGARHVNICRAWLGAWVDAEDEAEVPDQDRYDDGVLATAPLEVRVSNWNWAGYLYLNALVDVNADGDWEDAGEWALQNLPVSVPKGKSKQVQTDAAWDGDSWLRLTLTGNPISNYTGRGEFAIGETEDYPFTKFRLSVYVQGNGTVTGDPLGIDCRKDSGPCSAEYQAGSSVNLTADPDTGESFLGWGGDCSGANATCTVVMNADRRVYASFTQPYYRLTVYVVGENQTYGGGGNVTSAPPGIHCGGYRSDPGGWQANCTAVFARGTNVTLTAIPDPGWIFLYWSGDCTGTAPTCSVLMDRDRTVIAYFQKL